MENLYLIKKTLFFLINAIRKVQQNLGFWQQRGRIWNLKTCALYLTN